MSPTDDLRWDADGLIPAVVQETGDRRGAHGRVDEPRGARGDAAHGPQPFLVALAATRSGARARRPATSSTWTASMLTATGHAAGAGAPGRASRATPERGPASSPVSTAAVAAPAAGARAPPRSRSSSACSSRAKVAPPPGSYVAGLLDKGQAQICRKIGEEATEVDDRRARRRGRRARGLGDRGPAGSTRMVLLARPGIPLRRVFAELARAVTAAGRRTGRLIAGPAAATRRAACLVALVAARRLRDRDGPDRERHVLLAKGYRVTLPDRGLARGGRPAAPTSLWRGGPAGGMLADATCEGASPTRPLPVLARHLDLRAHAARRAGERHRPRGRPPGGALGWCAAWRRAAGRRWRRCREGRAAASTTSCTSRRRARPSTAGRPAFRAFVESFTPEPRR